ncbi:MAG: helix-turn-helix transcriptional regulator [Oceanospirillaceae bacterium]|nr:helix-turn-helix transcriptional regulator [Oceanospirillaceae bacterium]
MLSDKQLLALADEIYEVALDPSYWEELLTSLTSIFRSDFVGVITQDHGSGFCTWFHGVGMDDHDIVRYATYYGTISPTFFQLQVTGVGDVITDEMHLNRRIYTNSEFYNDFLKPLKLERSAALIMERNAHDQTYLALRRPDRNHYTDEELQDFSRVASHLYRAIKLQRRTHFQDRLETAINDALDHVKSGLVLLAPDGSAIKFNKEAERIIAAHDGVYVRGNRLYIERSSCLVDASRLVNGDCSTNPQHPESEAVAIQRPLKRPYILFAYPLGRNDGNTAIHSGTAVFITDTERNHNLTTETIGQIFGLTPAEARLTAALAEGRSLQEYSDAANIAISTARSTLKSVFKKTQTSRQTELVRLVFSCTGSTN